MKRFLTQFFSVTGVTSVLMIPVHALAHEGVFHEHVQAATPIVADMVTTVDAEGATRLLSLQVVGVAAAIIGMLVIAAIVIPKKSDILKHLLFWPVAATVVIATLIMAFMTIQLNVTSWSKGPIHWHADFEVWACGQELELVDPQGLSNKIGSPSRHEHNDNRLHYEGVVNEPTDASLSSFFKIIGGSITNNALTFPTNDGMKSFQNGQSCHESASGGVVNMFVYSVNDDDTYSQRKITDPAAYIIRDESQVPSGDCIIIEFGEDKTTTDKLCRSYRVADEIDKLQGEVPYGN